MKLWRVFPLLLWRFRREAKMVWAMLVNARTPLIAKVVAIAGLLYLASPVDFVPDLIPILGWLDDGVIVTLLLSLAFKLLPRELYEELRKKTGRKDDAQAATGGQTIEGSAKRAAQ